jgi:hypothetical protein
MVHTVIVRRFGAESWRDALARAGDIMGAPYLLLSHYGKLASLGWTPEAAVKEVMRCYTDGNLDKEVVAVR